MISITVLTVTYKRAGALRRYLESLVSANRFADVQALILIYGADPKTEVLLNSYAQSYRNIQFIKSDKCTRGRARNTLMAKSPTSEIYFFLDDDCEVAKDAFHVLMEVAEIYPDIDCFGGPNLTRYGANTFKQAQGCALGSFFGALWVRDRYCSRGKPRLVDDRSLILCNLAIRRRVFESIPLHFDEAVICAEENLLIQELLSAGHKCMHIPHMLVFHERKDTFSEFFSQIFTYGRGRCEVFKKNRPMGRYIVLPFVFSFLVLGVLFFRFLSCYIMIGVSIYMALCILNAFGISWVFKKIVFFRHLLLLFPSIHVAYALGFIYELLPLSPLYPSLLNIRKSFVRLVGPMS